MNQSEKGIVVCSQPASALSTTASGLKLRVQNIAKSLQNQTDALGEDRTHLDRMKSAACSPSRGLVKELDAAQKFFQAELQQIEQELKAKVDDQKKVNVSLQQCLTTLKTEKTMLHQQIMAMQHKVEEIEEEIGFE
ncbi:conserved hypothetical protein [Perkinsus marinus ATCC 50983]|uniref:Uncharacterized protein n=1 Tax=Perkinsus marinus (strain ATCC 50983 / TXsc) TaxID=423536 RepID=C5KHR3_PERM5|nr:conserved hypothetical protein [Perkinsus marinus ATCC 50983]EER16125.1 conserved hypothetical protein [Perkinsus marinus ATCC 50983]|eukprot:XP_002784329.1 conserved hypothetical protein [Perkinsus marinus ATCC 50983]